MAKQLNVNLAFTADTAQAKRQLNDLQRQLTELMQTSTKSGTMNITKEIKEAEHAAASLKAHLNHAINVDTGKLDLGLLNKSFQEAGVNLGYYRQKLQKLGLEGEKAFSSLTANILKADVPLKQTNALLQQFATTLKNTARWQISSSLLHGFMGSVQTAYYYAEDLNESLNNIRIVTGQNTEQMARFAKEANEAAKTLSTTTTEYTNASLIYYQQGLSDAEVKERTDATVKMANVTRTAAQEVSQQMTAIWNNFADGSKTLEYYSDVVTALGAATASSSAEISEGLEKFAAVANTVGLSYEYATAALATVTATTRQSADVVGNAFKTLFARLESLKLGDILDDGTDLNKYSQALAQVGVNIKDTNGQLKNMDTILDELGEKWTTLGKDQQMALASTVAGVRQYTQLIALMENWDFFQQNVGVARGSEGTLQEQADIYAESWEAARDRVKAAAEEIYSQLLNDDFFIKLNDGFADALKVVSKLIEGLGGVKGIISVLSTMMLSLFSKDISNGINNFLYNFRDQKKVAQDMKDRAVGEITGMVGTEYGQYYNMIAEAQESYLLNVNDMSEIEKTIARDLLDQHEARVKNLIDQKQQLEEEQKLLNVENQAVQRKKDKVSNLEQGYLDQASQTSATVKQSEELRKAMGGYKQVALLSSRIPKISEIFDAKGIGGAKEIAEKLKGIQSSSKSFSTEIQNALKLLKSGKGNIEEIAQAIDILEKAEKKNGSSKESDQEGKLNNTANERLLSAFREIADSEEAAQEAFRKYTASVDDATRAEEGFNEKNDEIQQKKDDLKKSTDEATEATGELEKSFEDANAPALTFGTTLQGVVQTVSSLAMVANALKGLGDLWSDEEASDGEKILGTLTTFGMILPMITNLKNLYNKTSLVTQKNSFKEWLGHKLVAAGLAEEAVAAEGAAATTTMFNIAAGGTVAIMGALALAIGAVVGVVWLLVQAYKANQAASPEGQFKAATKAAEELAKAYDDIKSSYDDLKTSLEDYNSAKTALEEMTERTQEWKEAVVELNEQVLDLLDKYPQLSEFVSSNNGYLEISEEGQNRVLESQLERIQTAYQNKLLSQANVSRTSINKDVAELAERSTYKGSNGTYRNAEYLDIPVLAEEVEKVIEVISKEGISITENTATLAKATGIDEKHIEAILKNKNELVKLTNKITTSKEANKIQTTELGKSLVGDTASNQFYDQLTYLIGQRAQEEFSKNPNAKGYSKEEIRTRYAELNNYTHLNKDTYLVNGESQEIDLSTAKTAVAMADAQERATSSLAEYTQALQTFQEVSSTGSETILNFVSGLDTSINNLTSEDIKQLDKFYGEITSGNYSEEDLAFLNFLDKDLLDNLKGGKLTEEFNKASGDIADGVLSSVKGIYEAITNNSDLTLAGQAAISDTLKRALALGSDDAVDFIKEGFEKGGGQVFADLLGSIKWNTTDLETFKQLLNESGVQFGYSDEELEQLISTMQNLPPVTQDAVTAFKALHDVIDNLANGGTISSEQYEALGGDLYESFFLKMADGSYKLTTDAQSFYDLVNQRSIESFEQNIDTIKNLMGSSNINYLTEPVTGRFDPTKVSNQLDFLRSSGYNDIDKLAEWSNGELNPAQMAELTRAVQETAEAVGGLNGALGENMERLASTATNLGELHEMFKEDLAQDSEEAGRAFTKAAMAMDAATDTENLDPEELAEYTKYLQEASKNMEGFNDEMSKDEARIVAKGIMKMNDAIETLSSNWKNWSDILDNSTAGSEEYMEAMSGSRQAVADLLDISEEYVSSDFVLDHLEEIGKAAEGSAEAIDDLKKEMLADIVMHLDLDDSNISNTALLNELQGLQAQIPDLKVGATFEDESFFTSMNELLASAGMTVDQVNAIFDALGFEANFQTAPIPTKQRVPEYVTETVNDGTTYDEKTGLTYLRQRTRTYQDGYYEAEGAIDAVALSTNGKTPKISGITKKASGSANNHSSSNKGGGSGGGGGKEPSHKDPVKDKPDRYYDINNAISSINEELERNAQLQQKLGALQDHYQGEALIKSLEQENELLQTRNTILESQYSNYEKLYEIQSQELGELKGKIGGEWDGNVLQNYSDLFQANVDRYNAAIETYNNMSAEEQEASGNQMVEDAKEAYDTYKDALDRYQDLYYNEMYETENKLAELRQQLLENHLKIIENNLKSWEVKVQLKLDTTKLEREWNKFLHDMETDFRKVYKNLTVDSLNSSSDFMSYLDDVETKMQEIRDVEAEIDKMEAAKNEDGVVVLSDDMMFGSISEAQEKLKELQGELIDANNNLREAYKQTWDNYLEGLEQAAKNFEDISKKFDHINNQLEYEKELIELIYGDKAFDLMDKYYETQRRNIETQIDSTRQQAEFWEDQFRKAYEMNKEEHGVSLDDMSTWTEDMKKAYDQMISSQEELNNLVIEGIKTLQDEYLNNVAKAFNEMDNAIWGMDFTKVKEDWDFIQKRADEYLDDVEGAYKIQTLANKIDMSISETSSLQAQQKLAKLRENEIDYLREKENLTQDDIDLAEARYQIALKEIALEEAQNNKTSMKLTRDTSGNWTYQYVADDEDVKNKQQELLDAYNNLYETADNAYNHAMNLAMETYEEMQARMQEVANDMTLTEEQKQQRIQEIYDEYLPLIDAAFENSQLYQQEVIYATGAVFAEVCEQDEDAYISLTDTQKALVDEIKNLHLDDYEEIREAIQNAYGNIKDYATDAFRETNENSKTVTADIIRQWDKGKDSVKEAVHDAFISITQYTSDYIKKLEELEKASGHFILDEGGVVSDIDKIGDAINEVGDDTEEMVDRMDDSLDELRGFVDEVANCWDGVISKIQEAIATLREYIQTMSDALSTVITPDTDLGDADVIPDNGGGDGGSGGGNNDDKKPEKKPIIKEPTNFIVTSLPGGQGVTLYVGSSEADCQHWIDQQKGKDGKGKTIGYVWSYDTGGYTGSWDNTSGRLAMLHQKELVLNATDTENMLQAVDAVRDISKLNDSIGQTIASAIGNLIVNTMFNAGKNINSSSNNNTSNVFNITAEFPNADDVQTIRDAILSLPNVASQFIHES